MKVQAGPALAAGAAGVAIAVGGLQTWVNISGSGVLIHFSGMGNFSAPSSWNAAAVAGLHGMPIAWATNIAGAIMIAAAALHLLGAVSATSIAWKGLGFPAVVSAGVAIYGMLNKEALLTVGRSDLASFDVSSGHAPVVVLIGAIVGLYTAFQLSARAAQATPEAEYAQQ
ncbi:hypothetical protein [Mycobacteroides abscessus]|uniref:hypothetical protein n=1 Tax=Mycobacteroides abscessus TaxID=36809 RepID=UPI000C25AD52|nr:hypothetical protein [Mycobacteroides abscessus]